MTRTAPALRLLLLGLGAAACAGSIDTMGGDDDVPGSTPGDRPAGTPSGRGGSGSPTGAAGAPGGLIDMPKPGMPGAMQPAGCNASAPLPATPRPVRLTRQQYENSVRDLTGLDVRPGKDLPEDSTLLGFNRGLDFEVGDLHGRVFREQAEAVARMAVASPAAITKLTGCDPKTGDACMNTFIADFGKRAFRRPLTTEEKTRYTNLFKAGATLVESGDAFTKGVQVTLEAMLQSPHFLYRLESSTKRDGALVQLSSWDVASRLSYMIANSMPDPMLMAAAEKDQLTDPANVVTHARRLLETEAGKAMIRELFGQWMHAEEWTNNADKNAMRYPAWKSSLVPALVREVELFAEEVTFKAKKGLPALLTSSFTFANKATAAIYGVSGPTTDALAKVELNPMQRAGVITQLGFLAGNANSTTSSPIHRGVFVQRALLCTTIPPPGEQVPPVPPVAAGKTTREVVQEHTAGAGCAACHHKLINPVGYGLENFDAIGAWRTMENGKPIDATGSLPGTKAAPAFNGPVEMAKAIAGAPESRVCYARNWLRYSFGREEKEGDACAIEVLGEAIGKESYTATDVVADLVRTKAFMYRSAEGL